MPIAARPAGRRTLKKPTPKQGPEPRARDTSRSRRKDPGPEHIGQILETLFRETGLAGPVRENRAALFWEEAAGEGVSRHTRAAYVEQGTLWVEVDHSVRMHSLQMQEEDLRRRLNQAIRQSGDAAGSIRQIRFRLMESA